MHRFACTAVACVLAIGTMAAQQSVPAPDHAANAGVTPATSTGSETPPPYRLFNLVAEDSLKEKMNQYGATGYRFVGIATVEGGATQIVMEAAAGGPYEYEFASGSIFKHKLQESMNAAGARGFRLYPPSLRTTKWPTRLSAPEYGVVMEKTPATVKCEYRMVMPVQFKNVEKDIVTALTEGFRPVAALRENIVFMERCGNGQPVPASAAAGLFHTAGWDDLNKRDVKIAENTAGGYRIVTSGFGWTGKQHANFFLLLERTANASPGYKYLVNDYKVPEKDAPRKDQRAEFEGQLNELSRTGYRVVGVPIVRTHYSGLATLWSEVSALLEKSEDKYEYQVVLGEDTPALARKLAELHGQGYRLVPGGMLDGDVAVVERRMPAGAGQ